MRRFPVFFVLDCSESMVGQPLESVQEGVEFILSSLEKILMRLKLYLFP